MRAAAACLCLCLCLLAPGAAAALEEGGDVLDETRAQLESYDLEAWEAAASGFSADMQRLWGEKDMRAWMLDYAAGEAELSPAGAAGALKEGLRAALGKNAALLSLLFAAALLSGVSALLFDGDAGLKELLSLILCAMTVSAAAAYFLGLVQEAQGALARVSAFSQSAIPVLSTMLAATGRVASAGMMRPLMAFLSGSVIGFFEGVVLPAITAAGLFSIVGSLGAHEGLKGFARLVKSFCKWSVGLLFTIYLGTLSLQGMSLSGADSVGLRTIKYTLDKSIPVIGGVVSGTLDTVRGCAVLVKNAAGAATLLLTLAYVLEPCMQMLAASFALKLCAALCAPVSDGRIVRMMEEIGSLCSYLLAGVLAAALMFMILSGMCMAMGNG